MEQMTDSDSSENEAFSIQSTDTGILPLTPEVWDKFLPLYLMTYRGPNDELELRTQLEGYYVLTKTGRVAAGRYVRYMPKSIVDMNLKRGGYVAKCNSKTIRLQDGRRVWQIPRTEHFIFVRDPTIEIDPMQKSQTRLLVEEMLKADEELRQRKVNFTE